MLAVVAQVPSIWILFLLALSLLSFDYTAEVVVALLNIPVPVVGIGIREGTGLSVYRTHRRSAFQDLSPLLDLEKADLWVLT